MAASFTLVLEQGAQRDLTFKLVDSSGNAIDVSGTSALIKIRETFDSTAALLTLTSSPPAGLTMGGAAGTIAMIITATQTAALVVERARWELLWTDGGGAPRRLLEGPVNILRRVTQ